MTTFHYFALFACALLTLACGSMNQQTQNPEPEKWGGEFRLYHFVDGGEGVKLLFGSGRELLLQPMPGKETDRWMYSIPGRESFDYLVVYLNNQGEPNIYGMGNTRLCITVAEARRVTDSGIWKVDVNDLRPVDPTEAARPECAQWLADHPPST